MNPDPATHDDVQDQKLAHILRTIDKKPEPRMEDRRDPDPVAQSFEVALRRILDDDDLVRSFWQRGYRELADHAGNGASQWIGRRILTAFVVAAVTAGIVWLVKSGNLK